MSVFSLVSFGYMQIVENDLTLLDSFIHLNEDWIKEYFELEEADRKLAANPQKVIKDGGYIFSLLSDEQKVMGVCALFNIGNDTFELARMAVAKEARGKGYGSVLIEACLSKLKNLKARKVYLVSNTRLEAAINLYKKHNVKTVQIGQHPIYARANIIMEISLLTREE